MQAIVIRSAVPDSARNKDASKARGVPRLAAPWCRIAVESWYAIDFPKETYTGKSMAELENSIPFLYNRMVIPKNSSDLI
jgi:hypothetical protein